MFLRQEAGRDHDVVVIEGDVDRSIDHVGSRGDERLVDDLGT